MDIWKGLLEFVIFYSQLQHPWADSLLFVLGCTRYITRKDIMMVEFEKNPEACGCTNYKRIHLKTALQ